MKKVVALVLVGLLLLAGSMYLKKHKHALNFKAVPVEDIRVGDGAPAVEGKFVTVEYTLYLEEGMVKIDSSKDRGQLFHFQVGSGQVIPGWDKGMDGMKVNGLRKIYVPAKLGYGAKGAGRVVPPNSNLVYEVELKAVNDLNPVAPPAPAPVAAEAPKKAAPALKDLPKIPSNKVVAAPAAVAPAPAKAQAPLKK
jgi:hypothetical protein